MASQPEDARGAAPETWYLLRIAPGTAHPYQLTKLPIKLPGNSPDGFAYALSPDDRELAVESQSDVSSSGDTVTTLGIYSVSSGAELRAWTASKILAGSGRRNALLAFRRPAAGVQRLSRRGTACRYQLRTLDVTGSGTDLMTASRALLT